MAIKTATAGCAEARIGTAAGARTARSPAAEGGASAGATLLASTAPGAVRVPNRPKLKPTCTSRENGPGKKGEVFRGARAPAGLRLGVLLARFAGGLSRSEHSESLPSSSPVAAGAALPLLLLLLLLLLGEEVAVSVAGTEAGDTERDEVHVVLRLLPVAPAAAAEDAPPRVCILVVGSGGAKRVHSCRISSLQASK